MTDSGEAVAPQEIDRLVDGELSDADRRALLLRLDRQPSGWRLCALAFLEAQTWRTTARSMADDAPLRLDAPTTPAVHREARRVSLSRRWLSLAAATLLAFGLGSLLGPHWSVTDERLAVREASEPERDVEARSSQADQGHTAAPAPAEEASPEAAGGGVRVVGLARFGDEEGMQPAVPIVSGPGLDEDWLRAQPELLPESARRQLERRGWRVKQGRKLFSVELNDGSRVTIPVECVRYQFVGQEVF